MNFSSIACTKYGKFTHAQQNYELIVNTHVLHLDNRQCAQPFVTDGNLVMYHQRQLMQIIGLIIGAALSRLASQQEASQEN